MLVSCGHNVYRGLSQFVESGVVQTPHVYGFEPNRNVFTQVYGYKKSKPSLNINARFYLQ